MNRRSALQIIALTPLSTGCGFRLRGTAELPFSTLYVPNATGGIALDLARNIRVGTNVKLVPEAKGAEAILQ